MTRRTPRATVRRAAALVVLAALTAACSDDADPATTADEPASATSSSDATSEPTAPAPTTSTEPTEPTEPAEPTSTVAPATGPPMQLGPLSLRAPEGFRVLPAMGAADLTAEAPDGITRDLVILVVLPRLGVDLTTEELGRNVLTEVGWARSAKALEPVVVGGVEMSHVRGRNAGTMTDNYSALVGDSRVSMSFSYGVENQTDKAHQQALMDEVLATAEWSA